MKILVHCYNIQGWSAVKLTFHCLEIRVENNEMESIVIKSKDPISFLSNWEGEEN